MPPFGGIVISYFSTSVQMESAPSHVLSLSRLKVHVDVSYTLQNAFARQSLQMKKDIGANFLRPYNQYEHYYLRKNNIVFSFFVVFVVCCYSS